MKTLHIDYEERKNITKYMYNNYKVRASLLLLLLGILEIGMSAFSLDLNSTKKVIMIKTVVELLN